MEILAFPGQPGASEKIADKKTMTSDSKRKFLG